MADAGELVKYFARYGRGNPGWINNTEATVRNIERTVGDVGDAVTLRASPCDEVVGVWKTPLEDGRYFKACFGVAGSKRDKLSHFKF